MTQLLDIGEVDRRIADIDRRIESTKYQLSLRLDTISAIGDLKFPDASETPADAIVLRNCAAVLRSSLLVEYDAGVRNLELLMAELRTAREQLRALKFGASMVAI